MPLQPQATHISEGKREEAKEKDEEEEEDKAWLGNRKHVSASHAKAPTAKRSSAMSQHWYALVSKPPCFSNVIV